jgi:hypothetical protein
LTKYGNVVIVHATSFPAANSLPSPECIGVDSVESGFVWLTAFLLFVTVGIVVVFVVAIVLLCHWSIGLFEFSVIWEWALGGAALGNN